MDVQCHVDDDLLEFGLGGVAPAYQQAVRELGFSEIGDRFRRVLPLRSHSFDFALLCRNFKRDAEEMVLQTARAHVTPWEQALHALLDKVAPHKLDWWIGGSAALAIRGLDIPPRDFDLVTDEHGARQLGVILSDYLIEPVIEVNWFCRWWGRAFLHARIEWVGEVDERADEPEVSDFGPTAAGQLESVEWHGYTLWVPPLDLQLQVSKRRGLEDRVVKIERFLEVRVN